ncbi:HAD-like protein [Imleria badia]|nr:HAD-like protein [Imleria badia]
MIPVVLRGAVRTRTFAPRSVRYLASQVPPKATSSKQPPPPPTTSSLPSLDFAPAERSEHPERAGRTGAKSSKDSLSSIERRKRYLARVSLAILAVALGVQVLYLGRDWEADELASKKIKIEDAPSGRWARTKARFTDMFDYFNKPAWTELLPPPLPSPHQKPFTLLVSMDDLLVTSTWDRQKGWRTAKRPGVDYFLAYLSQFYEIVIFTSQQNYTAIPIIEKLDPYNFFITYKLFREATRSVDGKIVKDLSYLNRDLSKVILLDTHEEHVSTHPENSIVLSKWTGTPGDKGLVAMIPFLESIAIYNPPDVRPILQAYQGKDIPIEYAKKEAEARERHVVEWKSKSKGLSSGGFTMSSLFGMSTEPSHSPIPLTYLEQKRAEAQRQYKADQAFIASHKAEFDKALEEEKQAMAKEMSGSLLGLLDNLGGKKPQDEGESNKTAAGGGEGQVQVQVQVKQ